MNYSVLRLEISKFVGEIYLIECAYDASVESGTTAKLWKLA